MGVIPENYVQALADPPEPIEPPPPPPPLATFSSSYPHPGAQNGNNNMSRTPFATAHYDEGSYMNSSTVNNWPSVPPQANVRYMDLFSCMKFLFLLLLLLY